METKHIYSIYTYIKYIHILLRSCTHRNSLSEDNVVPVKSPNTYIHSYIPSSRNSYLLKEIFRDQAGQIPLPQKIFGKKSATASLI